MRITRIAVLAPVAVMALGLAGCSGAAAKLTGKTLPDETQVIDGPTLALPPQFELRPPREAADYESVLRAQKGIEAQNLITTGVSTSSVAAPAAGGDVPAADEWLVNKTSAQTGVVTDPNVRHELTVPSAEEVKAQEAAQKKKGLFQRWFGSSDTEE